MEHVIVKFTIEEAKSLMDVLLIQPNRYQSRALNKVQKALDEVRKKMQPKSWWCQQCSQEVYSLRCKYCGKSETEES